PRGPRDRARDPREAPDRRSPRGRRVSLAMQLAFRRLPIRLRLTIAFAGVLTSVLVGVGGPDAGLTRSREKLAQAYDPNGALVASTPALAHARLLTAAQARRADHGLRRLWRVGTPAGPAGVVVRVAHAAGGPVVVAVAEPLVRRDHALDRLAE